MLCHTTPLRPKRTNSGTITYWVSQNWVWGPKIEKIGPNRQNRIKNQYVWIYQSYNPHFGFYTPILPIWAIFKSILDFFLNFQSNWDENLKNHF